MRAAVLRIRHPRLEDERNPEVGLLGIGQRARRDADDRVLVAVERDRSADDVRIGGELVAPQFVRQHDDVLRADRVLAGDETAAELHRHAEQLEEARADRRGVQALRFGADDGEVRAVAILDLRDGGEAVRLIPIVDESRAGTGDVSFPSLPDDPIRTSSSGSRKGSGLSSTPLTMLNTAVVAPMASASVVTAMIVKPGVRSSFRAA